MQFPLGFNDITQMLAALTIILLATYELINTYYNNREIILQKERLKKGAIIFGSFFLVTILIRIYQIIIS